MAEPIPGNRPPGSSDQISHLEGNLVRDPLQDYFYSFEPKDLLTLCQSGTGNQIVCQNEDFVTRYLSIYTTIDQNLLDIWSLNFNKNLIQGPLIQVFETLLVKLAEYKEEIDLNKKMRIAIKYGFDKLVDELVTEHGLPSFSKRFAPDFTRELRFTTRHVFQSLSSLHKLDSRVFKFHPVIFKIVCQTNSCSEGLTEAGIQNEKIIRYIRDRNYQGVSPDDYYKLENIHKFVTLGIPDDESLYWQYKDLWSYEDWQVASDFYELLYYPNILEDLWDQNFYIDKFSLSKAIVHSPNDIFHRIYPFVYEDFLINNFDQFLPSKESRRSGFKVETDTIKNLLDLLYNFRAIPNNKIHRQNLKHILISESLSDYGIPVFFK